MSLFRQEVIDARRQQWLGEIMLARPLSFSVLTGGAVLIAFILAGFLVWGEYTRKERVIGRVILTQGVAKVYSPVAGTIRKKFISDGQVVKVGQPLYLISIDRITGKGDTQVAIGHEISRKKDSLRAELANQQRVLMEEEAAIHNKKGDLQSQLVHIHREIVTQSKRVALSEAALTRFRDLWASKFISVAQLSEHEQEKLDQESRLQVLQRSEVAIQADITSMNSQLKNAPLRARNQLAGIEREISSVEQENYENEARREIAILARQAGQVSTVLAEEGQNVNPSIPMMSLLPVHAAFEAALFVPSRAVGFLKEGGEVQLRYEAFPYQKFGQYAGSIMHISRSALTPDELQILKAPPEKLYRVTVKLDRQHVIAFGKQLQLQDGMQLEADILLEKRKLFEWVLEPLYSLTGKF